MSADLFDGSKPLRYLRVALRVEKPSVDAPFLIVTHRTERPRERTSTEWVSQDVEKDPVVGLTGR